MARLLVSCAFAAGLLLPLAVLGDDAVADGTDSLSRAFQGAQPVGGNTYSVTGKKDSSKGLSAEELLKSIGDDEDLVVVDGSEKLKWGLLRRHVMALCSAIDRPDMQVEGNEALKSVAFHSRLRKLLKDYVEHSIFAVEARRSGITLDASVFEEYREKARAGYARMGETGKALRELMDEGESFYEHNLTNALYWQAYRDSVLAPQAATEPGEAERLQEIVRAANEAAVATNRHNRVLIADILSKLRGGMEFGDAAEKWSDCDSSVTRGVMMDGLEEHPERFAPGDLPDEVEAALASLKEGEMSGVVETPVAWHIVRLLKRNVPDDGDPTVEIAQIMIEKRMLQPELTPSQARARVQAIKMKAVLKAKFAELVNTVKVDSRIPLWEPADPNKRSVKIKRIK